MSKHRVTAILSVAFVFSVLSRASAQGPVAGPLEVSVQSFGGSVTPGEVGQVGFAVENHATRLSIEVAVRMTITYSNGTQQTIVPDNPGVLGPDEGFVQFLFFPVPVDSPPGTATVRASAVVTHVSGTLPKGLERPLLAVDQDTFEVVTARSGRETVAMRADERRREEEPFLPECGRPGLPPRPLTSRLSAPLDYQTVSVPSNSPSSSQPPSTTITFPRITGL